jgi:hypothetical protein
MATEYRKANEIADVIDFFDGITDTETDRKIAAELRTELAEQERLDGIPADPKEERRGFLGAI